MKIANYKIKSKHLIKIAEQLSDNGYNPDCKNNSDKIGDWVIAYDDNCDYFYQCGDDIEFMDKDWKKDCINILKSHNNEGVTGPID